MQTVREKQYGSRKDFAFAARRREGLRATRKAATKGMAGFGILVLLFLASLAYVVFGGKFAIEASPLPEAVTSKAEVAVMTADASGTLRKQNVLVRSAEPAGYFHAAYPNRGRDSDGNVMTYEHD